MLSRVRSLWRLPHLVIDSGAQTRRAVDDLIQAVRDLDATIKTHWAVDPAAERPAKPQRDAGDPHGL